MYFCAQMKQNIFFEKLRILLSEGAVDLNARSHGDLRAIDIIEKKIIVHGPKARLLLARKILTDLENNPDVLKRFNLNNVAHQMVRRPEPVLSFFSIMVYLSEVLSKIFKK